MNLFIHIVIGVIFYFLIKRYCWDHESRNNKDEERENNLILSSANDNFKEVLKIRKKKRLEERDSTARIAINKIEEMLLNYEKILVIYSGNKEKLNGFRKNWKQFCSLMFNRSFFLKCLTEGDFMTEDESKNNDSEWEIIGTIEDKFKKSSKIK